MKTSADCCLATRHASGPRFVGMMKQLRRSNNNRLNRVSSQRKLATLDHFLPRLSKEATDGALKDGDGEGQAN